MTRDYALTVFFVLLFAVALPSLILARTESNINFPRSGLFFYQEKGFTRISLPNSRSLTQVGAPELPRKGISLVIPQDVKVEGVKILSYERELLEGEFYLYPTQKKIPIGYPPAPFVEPDPLFYDSDSPYPGKIMEVTGDGYMEGFHIVHILVYPLEYIPQQRKLYLYKDIAFEIEYTDAKRSYFQPTRIGESTIKRLSSFVHNPQDVKVHQPKRTFAKSSLLSSDSIPYVIITTDYLKSTYESLKEWKTRKGTKTEIRTISEIGAAYTGEDLAEKIKKFIIEAKADWDTKWILFGGDVDSIPVRYTWSGAEWGSNILTDHYYSCLDNMWNTDEDDKWAEVFGDTTDLIPDGVYVGRVPLNGIYDTENFLEKLLSYERDSPYSDYQTKALFLSSFLFEDNDAKRWCDTVATTIPGNFHVSGTCYEYGEANGIDSLNQGFGIIVNCSHAQNCSNFVSHYDGWIEVIDKWDIFSLTNTNRYSIVFNATCLNNKLDGDCLSKYFMKNPSGGGVGYIGTADYEWYFESRAHGKEFLYQVFNNGATLGEAFMDAKMIFLPSAYGNSTERTRIMAYVLLGDPQMEIWTETPKDFTLSCSDTVLECGESFQGAHVESSGVDVESVLVCFQKENDAYELIYTNSSGLAHFNRSFFPGNLSVVASRKKFIPQSFTIEVKPFDPPTNVTATHVHNRIELSWIDNSETEDGFRIERKDSQQWYQIATVGANIENYTDNTVECDYTYCYRLQAYSSACDGGSGGYYSYPQCATTDTCPDPECPFLYVWNGEAFINDNVILTGSEDEDIDKSSLTDYYVLSQNLKPKDGRYELEIREFENEVSRIDHISLFAIDYPLSEYVGVTPEGKVWIYTDPISPITCIDQDGIDRLDDILAEDERYFVSKKPGHLIVNFGKLIRQGFFKSTHQMSSGGGGGTWPPPKDPTPNRLATGSGPKGNIAYVDVIGEKGEWQRVAKVYPRTRLVRTLVELSQFVDPNEDFKMKISWERSYSADHIAYYKFDDSQLTVTKLGLSSAIHSDKGDINTLLNSNDDQRVALSPDQAIKLSFTALPDDSSKQRRFLLAAKGYYEKLEIPARDSSGVARISTPEMDQNYPNPFNLSTEVRFTLPDAAKVTLNIYNILGQKVTTLVDGEKVAGTHSIFWDGKDKSGAEVASGIYFYRIKAGDFKQLKKMLLIK